MSAVLPELPPSTLPGFDSSSKAMLASLPAAPKANLYNTSSLTFIAGYRCPQYNSKGARNKQAKCLLMSVFAMRCGVQHQMELVRWDSLDILA